MRHYSDDTTSAVRRCCHRARLHHAGRLADDAAGPSGHRTAAVCRREPPINPAPDGAFTPTSRNVNNNAWISFINHDGSVHTARWVGIQNPGDQRNTGTPPLVLNEPFGSDIVNGVLYLADPDGGTSPTDPAVSVIRRFNMQTGAPGGEIRVEKSTGFNDIEVADDGTIYATQTGVGGRPSSSRRIFPTRPPCATTPVPINS